MIQSANGRTDIEPRGGPPLPEPSRMRFPERTPAKQSLEAWIGNHPVAGIAAALILGAALGWFIKRR
jgi:hypothetical protein